MYKTSLIILSLLSINIYADSLEIGCLPDVPKYKECSEENPLEDGKVSILESLDDDPKESHNQKVNITEELESLSITYQKKKIKI